MVCTHPSSPGGHTQQWFAFDSFCRAPIHRAGGEWCITYTPGDKIYKQGSKNSSRKSNTGGGMQQGGWYVRVVHVVFWPVGRLILGPLNTMSHLQRIELINIPSIAQDTIARSILFSRRGSHCCRTRGGVAAEALHGTKKKVEISLKIDAPSQALFLIL